MLRARLHEHEIRKVIGTPGDGDSIVDGLAPLDANEDHCLYFINHEVTASIQESLTARKGCIVIIRSGAGLVGAFGACKTLEVAHPRVAIARVLAFIKSENRQPPWVATRKIASSAVISPLSVIEGNTEIAENVVVEPFCTVDPDVKIGQGSILRSGARICSRVSIGEETVIGANAVIGSEGFGFVRDENDNKLRIPHLGGIIIGSHVEIGAVSVVQRGTILPTVIEDYAKIDDNVTVGHNARIGRGVSLIGGVVIGGSAVIDADAWIGINSSIRDGRRVGVGALVGMDASIQHDLSDYAVARAPRPDVRMKLGKKLTP